MVTFLKTSLWENKASSFEKVRIKAGLCHANVYFSLILAAIRSDPQRGKFRCFRGKWHFAAADASHMYELHDCNLWKTRIPPRWSHSAERQLWFRGFHFASDRLWEVKFSKETACRPRWIGWVELRQLDVNNPLPRALTMRIDVEQSPSRNSCPVCLEIWRRNRSGQYARVTVGTLPATTGWQRHFGHHAEGQECCETSQRQRAQWDRNADFGRRAGG